MSYQVFARKYRPQTFAQVVGQEHITRTLANAIQMGRLAQAYLLVGPRGTGKTSTARIIAKALNCPGGPMIDFDPENEVCREIAEGRSLDVLEIDGASNNGVDQVRDLRDNVRFAPSRGQFKVYIIDEVHMLTTAAFNALLKTLEEPPAHVKFILATTEVHKVLPTVLSRCQRFDFRRISEAKMTAHLRWICEQEKVTAEEEALQMIARQADGGLRDAEVGLDQVIGFFGNHITADSVQQMFGLTGLQPVIDLASALVQGDVAVVLKIARDLSQSGKDLARLAQDLLKFFRNVALYQISPQSLTEDVTAAEQAALAELSGQLTRHGVLALLEELSTFESRLRYATNKEVLFEVSLIQLAQLREKVSLEAILRVLSTDAPPEPTTAKPSVPSTPTPPIVVPKPVPTISVAEAWAAAVERFAVERPMEAEAIRRTRYVSSNVDTIEVALPADLQHKIAFFIGPRNLPILEESLQKDLGRLPKISFFAADPPVQKAKVEPEKPTVAAAPVPEPVKPSDPDFKNDPLIREALQLFQARIVPSK